MVDDCASRSSSSTSKFFRAAGTDSDGGAPSATPELDAGQYLPLLSEFELTDDEARELIAALWSIMRACVELGIRVDVCGELGMDVVPVYPSGEGR